MNLSGGKKGVKPILNLNEGPPPKEDPINELSDCLNDIVMNMDIQTDLLAKMALKQNAITKDEFDEIMKKDD